MKMDDDDGGLMFWQQLGAHEVEEFMAWLDKVEPIEQEKTA